ncbi:hypothetical protein GCM10010411_50490 [Actinomadura fulvescens]|uniref:Uncharacterized protein n=1 Tax=Actinomadura fulvescens TaxID=46160 RepID=A0ABN3Q1Y6_9ACTN
MRASVLAPVAVAVGIGSVPAHANEGPVAQLLNNTVGQVAPPQAAPVLEPLTGLGASGKNGALPAGKTAPNGQGAQSGQGAQGGHHAKGGTRGTAGRPGEKALRVPGAGCAQGGGGPIRGATGIVRNGPAGALASKVAGARSAGQRAASADPGTGIALSKQVRGPLGGTTNAAASVGSAPKLAGPGGDSGVVGCLRLKETVAEATEVAGTLPVGEVTHDLPVSGVARSVPVGDVTKSVPVGDVTGVLPVGKVAGGLQSARRARDGQSDPVTNLLGAVTGATSGTLPQGAPAVPGLGDPQRLLNGPTSRIGRIGGVPAEVSARAADGPPPAPGASGGPASSGVPGEGAAADEGGLSGLFGGLPGLQGLPLNAVKLPNVRSNPSKPGSAQQEAVDLDNH